MEKMQITAQEIYEAALAYVYEYRDKDRDYKSFFLPFLNALLAECLIYENAEREAAGAETLERAPVISGMDEQVNYCENITRIALPYGIASLYFQDEGDTYKMERYRNMYIEALEMHRRCVAVAMEDVW